MQKNSHHISQLEELADEKVAAELAEHIRKEELWAKALSVCECYEKKGKAHYINLRTKQILDELKPQSAPVNLSHFHQCPRRIKKLFCTERPRTLMPCRLLRWHIDLGMMGGCMVSF